MKKILLMSFVLSLLLFSQAQAQVLHQDSIPGIWVCKKAALDERIPEDMKAISEQLRKGFVGAKFIFKKEGVFFLEFPNTSSELLNDLKWINNKKWFYYPKENKLSIGTPKENLMHITVKKIEGEMFFLLYETPLALEMEKTDP